MRIRTVMGSLALGAALALGTTAATAQAAPTASSIDETAVAASDVFIGYYPSSTACHIAGTAMAGENHTCIRKGTRYALYIIVQ
ncbi:hypothetical protein OHT20_37500 [Streptomyces caniferus]|uniref:Chaplin domain-containing protein n=1 Tax=Streptomyces caniferus TaxID=285557 RepID=A0A640SAR0_9ACTN|nr:hypothetical protein [Streptomyces caniferus]GFE07556.1 hypothetical protein Scani_38240 [Streptomyces caniferus]